MDLYSLLYFAISVVVFLSIVCPKSCRTRFSFKDFHGALLCFPVGGLEVS